MKLTALLVCVFVFGTASAIPKYNPAVANEQRFEVGGAIEDFVNAYIDLLKFFDPVHIDKFYVNFLGLKAGFKNLNFEGFSDINFTLSINVGKVTKIDMSVGMNKVSGSVESWESNFPIVYGNGTAGFDINNAHASFKVDYQLFNGFSPCTIVTSIGSANAHVTGVLNDEVFSQEISDLVTHLLNDVVNSPKFHEMLEYHVDLFLSIFLKNMIEMH